MSATYIWGFGGVKFETSNGLSATLTHAVTSLSFRPISLTYTTLNHEQHIINMGYRAYIRVEAVNACDDDYSDFVDLVECLNAAAYSGYDLTVYPRYSTDDTSLSYNVRCVSDVTFESIAPTKSAQRIALEFESLEAVPMLPTLTSDQDWVYLVTQDADNLLTQAGENITIRG
jgi:hypothetical protein